MNELLALLIGYTFATVAGDALLQFAVTPLWDGFPDPGPGSDGSLRPAPHLARLTGAVERVLFLAAIQYGRTEFIGVWLAIKAAGHWKSWTESPPAGTDLPPYPGRDLVHLFLIENGFSIAAAAVGLQIVLFGSAGRWIFAITIAVGLALAAYALRAAGASLRPAARTPPRGAPTQ